MAAPCLDKPCGGSGIDWRFGSGRAAGDDVSQSNICCKVSGSVTLFVRTFTGGLCSTSSLILPGFEFDFVSPARAESLTRAEEKIDFQKVAWHRGEPPSLHGCTRQEPSLRNPQLRAVFILRHHSACAQLGGNSLGN